MRSIGMLAAATGALLVVGACSDNLGTPLPENENAAPVADFTLPTCAINVACEFASSSTDDAEVMAWSWDFDGDGTADATTANASFTYTADGDYDVSLTVHDVEGLNDTRTRTVAIAPASPPPPPPPPPPANTPPTAGFTHTCDVLTCSFTSTSSDVAPGTVVSHAWTFGDGGTSDAANPSHSYAVILPTDFTVTLTVTDDQGATGAVTQIVSVVPPPIPNTAPTAGFTHSCTASKCSFTSTSTDAAPGTIVSHAWKFGDFGTATEANPTHTYAVTFSTSFTVTLTVTDNEGLTGSITQTVTVTFPPPGPERCETVDVRVDCFLDVTSRSVIRLRLLGVSCDLRHERVVTPPPIGDQVFLNVCSRAVGDSTMIFGGPLDEAIVFEPGSQVQLRFFQGEARAGRPAPAPPAAQITGTFPNWVIHFEDGDNAGSPDEPDFADVVLGVEAKPAP